MLSTHTYIVFTPINNGKCFMKTICTALCLVSALICPAHAALLDGGEFLFSGSTRPSLYAGLSDTGPDNDTAGLTNTRSALAWKPESEFTPYDDPAYTVFKTRTAAELRRWVAGALTGMAAPANAAAQEPHALLLLCLGMVRLAILIKN